MYETPIQNLTADEILVYLRKSRSDSPEMSVEDVLRKHEDMIQEYALRNFQCRIPEKNMFREVVSGETIDSRPQMKQVLKLMKLTGIRLSSSWSRSVSPAVIWKTAAG